VCLVVLCFVIPLLAHENAAWIIKKIRTIRTVGIPLVVLFLALLTGGFLFGALKLFRFHVRHLESVLAQEKMKTVPPQRQLIADKPM
jgi:hypothetical protein